MQKTLVISKGRPSAKIEAVVFDPVGAFLAKGVFAHKVLCSICRHNERRDLAELSQVFFVDRWIIEANIMKAIQPIIENIKTEASKDTSLYDFVLFDLHGSIVDMTYAFWIVDIVQHWCVDA